MNAAPAARRPRAATATLRRLATVLLTLGLALALGPGGAFAQAQSGASGAAKSPAVRTSASPYQVRAAVTPAVAELGQRVTYQAWVRAERPATARWLSPDSGAAFTWGAPRVSAATGWVTPTADAFTKAKRKKLDPAARHDIAGQALFIEIPLQAFALGKLPIPGVQVEIDDGRGPRIFRLPVVTLEILPVLTAADSNADYRALHGPLAAPWWERVPWTWVVLGLLTLVTAYLVYRWLRRHRKTAVAPEAPVVALDPRAQALAALAALRAQHLPENGRFAEHAFRLGRILRQFLESTTGITRPGDTTPELVAHLKTAGLDPEDLTRFSSLLRVWDRVKFAREPFTLEEAVRSERSIETFLRRPQGAAERVA